MGVRNSWNKIAKSAGLELQICVRPASSAYGVGGFVATEAKVFVIERILRRVYFAQPAFYASVAPRLEIGIAFLSNLREVFADRSVVAHADLSAELKIAPFAPRFFD